MNYYNGEIFGHKILGSCAFCKEDGCSKAWAGDNDYIMRFYCTEHASYRSIILFCELFHILNSILYCPRNAFSRHAFRILSQFVIFNCSSGCRVKLPY